MRPEDHIHVIAYPCVCDLGYHNSKQGSSAPLSQAEREKMLKYSFGPYHMPDFEEFNLRQMHAPSVDDYKRLSREEWVESLHGRIVADAVN